MKLQVILLTGLVCLGQAHESPVHTLEQLNEHIARKPSPELLFQRAMAYRELGKIDLAAADLRTAAEARPANLPWQIERSRVELAAKRPTDALCIANAALKLAKSGPERAEIHILRAQAYQGSGKFKPSLHACQLAFSEVPAGKLEWFLLRSENQRQLGLHEQRIQDLRDGLKRYPSTILKSHWVDALIDAGKNIEALVQVGKELPIMRWKSHWQIKQARALIGLGREAEAASVLREALAEINGRINPARPDIFLLADKALIFILTGDHASARSALGELRRHNAPQWVTSRLESSLPGK